MSTAIMPARSVVRLGGVEWSLKASRGGLPDRPLGTSPACQFEGGMHIIYNSVAVAPSAARRHRTCTTEVAEPLLPHFVQDHVWLQKPKFQFFFRHVHGDLNLDEIKNALRLLSVNGETNLTNIIRL